MVQAARSQTASGECTHLRCYLSARLRRQVAARRRQDMRLMNWASDPERPPEEKSSQLRRRRPQLCATDTTASQRPSGSVRTNKQANKQTDRQIDDCRIVRANEEQCKSRKRNAYRLFCAPSLSHVVLVHQQKRHAKPPTKNYTGGTYRRTWLLASGKLNNYVLLVSLNCFP